MEANRSFPADVTSPCAARRFVATLLGHSDHQSTQTALVLTSELVTNAVLHAGTRVDVRVELEAGHVRVEVSDGDPHLPGPMECLPDALGGRGLFLVQELASAWGAETSGVGKVVWFTLPTGAPSPTMVGAA